MIAILVAAAVGASIDPSMLSNPTCRTFIAVGNDICCTTCAREYVLDTSAVIIATTDQYSAAVTNVIDASVDMITDASVDMITDVGSGTEPEAVSVSVYRAAARSLEEIVQKTATPCGRCVTTRGCMIDGMQVNTWHRTCEPK